MTKKQFTSTINDVTYNITHTKGDLPSSIFDLYQVVDNVFYLKSTGDKITFSFDCEFTGLISPRDVLKVVQIYDNIDNVWIVDATTDIKPDNLLAVLTSNNEKIGHYIIHDIVMIKAFFKEVYNLSNYTFIPNVLDTKILSFLARRYTSRHGYKTICQELLDISINKDVVLDFGDDWAENEELLNYAIVDVLHLKKCYEILISKVETKFETLPKALFDGINLQSELILHRIGMGIYLHNYDCKDPELIYHVYNSN